MNKKIKNKNKSSLKVKKVIDITPPIVLKREIDSRLPTPCFILTMICRIRSGKSNLIFWLLNSEDAYKDIFDMIYIIQPTIKNDRVGVMWKKMADLQDNIIIHDDMDTIDEFLRNLVAYQSTFDINNKDNQPPLVMVVLDDINSYLRNTSIIRSLISTHRHFNISLIISNQNIKGLPTIIRSSTSGVFLSKSSSFLEKTKILEEYGGLFHHKLISAWDYCVKGKYNFCYLKIDEEEPKMFKFGREDCEAVDWESFPIVAPTGLIKYLKDIDKNKNNKIN